jgi:hypothetical protein
MNDDEIMAVLRAAKESLTDVHMTRTADSIAARATSRRRRRALSSAGAGALAAGVGLGVAFSGTSGVTTASSAKSVHINLAAWSVNTTTAGTVQLAVREFSDPALLQQTLAQAGVPAAITVGQVCEASNSDQPPAGSGPIITAAKGGGDITFTINPAQMPAGTELSIGVLNPGSQTWATGVSLVEDGTALVCQDQLFSTPLGPVTLNITQTPTGGSASGSSRSKGPGGPGPVSGKSPGPVSSQGSGKGSASG